LALENVTRVSRETDHLQQIRKGKHVLSVVICLLMHGNISDNSHYYLYLQPLSDGTEH
jgi:hypothetical protein